MAEHLKSGQSTRTPVPDFPRPADHEQRMIVMRDLAGWHLGDKRWADLLIGAYLYPEATREALVREMDS